jgi:hypothetical protein
MGAPLCSVAERRIYELYVRPLILGKWNYETVHVFGATPERRFAVVPKAYIHHIVPGPPPRAARSP